MDCNVDTRSCIYRCLPVDITQKRIQQQQQKCANMCKILHNNDMIYLPFQKFVVILKIHKSDK